MYEQSSLERHNAYRKGETLSSVSLKKTTGETQPPAYLNEGTLLKAMENPASIFNIDKESTSTLKSAGGIGTVATRADIIEKLYNLNAIENNNGNIKVTNKGRQLLELAPDALKSPELTADWEYKLTRIEKNKYGRKQFMHEMIDFTKEIIAEIKSSDEKFKHDNLTSTECPTCGKFMLEKKRVTVRCLSAKIQRAARRRMFSVKRMRVAQNVRRS